MSILVLDGGMGTTLEALGIDVSTSPLWGCELVHTDPDFIKRVHSGYATAGADLISTATYQLSVPALVGIGHSEDAAASILRKAVAVAGASAGDAQLVVSLGPFGAHLFPGQEYTGFYPPPYGPQGYSADGPSTNYTAPGPVLDGYEAALAAYHLDRLRTYASDEATWKAVGWLAFETVPVLSEVRGIRRAVAQLYTELSARWGEAEWWRKPFWITSAFPDGKHGQLDAAGEHVPVSEVIGAMLGPISGNAVVPNGVGMNCTNPSFLAGLAAQFTDAAAALKLETEPRFVLYPDGGSVYDVVHRCWSDAARVPPADWAEQTVAVARGVVTDSPVWGGAIVGGCCKSSFDEVSALRAVVGERK